MPFEIFSVTTTLSWRQGPYTQQERSSETVLPFTVWGIFFRSTGIVPVKTRTVLPLAWWITLVVTLGDIWGNVKWVKSQLSEKHFFFNFEGTILVHMCLNIYIHFYINIYWSQNSSLMERLFYHLHVVKKTLYFKFPFELIFWITYRLYFLISPDNLTFGLLSLK